MDKYAVMGNPIAHSLSPDIHHCFAQQTAQSLMYERIEVKLGHFSDALALFQQQGGRGLNITSPFKIEAYTAMNVVSPRAKLAGAVNTILLQEDGVYRGDNTDGVGLMRDLARLDTRGLFAQRVLVIGAGGAARGILPALLKAGVAELKLLSHTPGLAQQVIQDLASPLIKPFVPGSLHEPAFDWVINAAGVHSVDKLPHSILHKDTFCYDLSYAQELTPFLVWANRQGVTRLHDGLGMLIEQAAESFFIWRGVRPDTHGLIARFR